MPEILNEIEQSYTWQVVCPSCGGTYMWDSGEQRHECDRCGDVMDIKKPEPELPLMMCD
jgi:rRNA maturation endonuclease Nob1